MATSLYFGAKARGRIGDKIYSVQNSEQRIQTVAQQWNDGCTFEQAESRLINLSCTKVYNALKRVSQDTFGCNKNKRLNFGRFMALNYEQVRSSTHFRFNTVSIPWAGLVTGVNGLCMGGYIIADGNLAPFPMSKQDYYVEGAVYYATNIKVQDYTSGDTYISFQQIAQLFYGMKDDSNYTVVMSYLDDSSEDQFLSVVTASFRRSSQWDGDVTQNALRKVPNASENIYQIYNDRQCPLALTSDRQVLFYVDDDGYLAIGFIPPAEDIENPVVGVIHWRIKAGHLECSRTVMQVENEDVERCRRNYAENLERMHKYMHRKRSAKNAESPEDI